MKTIVTIPTLLLFAFSASLPAQTMRYFQTARHTEPGGEYNWLDSSFVVAASDPALLAEIELDLAKPANERRHINGPIKAGNAGFNHNADFWFSWHMTPDAWALAELSIELCDGRPYTDVELDTAYWIQTVGQFCPWSSYIAREVSAPTSTPEPGSPDAAFLPVVPNPADQEVLITWELKRQARVALTVTDASGRLSITYPMGIQNTGFWTKSVATSALSGGVYFATLTVNNQVLTQRFVVQH